MAAAAAVATLLRTSHATCPRFSCSCAPCCSLPLPDLSLYALPCTAEAAGPGWAGLVSFGLHSSKRLSVYGWAESLQQPHLVVSLSLSFASFPFVVRSVSSDFLAVWWGCRWFVCPLAVAVFAVNVVFECHALVTYCCGVMMLLWELLSGRRNKNKDKVRHQTNNSSPGELSTTATAVPAANVAIVSGGAASTAPSSSSLVTAVNNAGRRQHEQEEHVNVHSLRVNTHHSTLSESLSSPPSPHPPGSAAIASSLFSLPQSKQILPTTLFKPPIGCSSFANRTPDSIKLFKNSVLSRRHSTSAGLSPGLLGCPSNLGSAGGPIGGNSGPQRARRRRGEDAQRFSDRRRQQHKYIIHKYH